MISTFFITIFTQIMSGLLSLLPTATFPTQWVTAVYALWGYVNAFSFIVPVGTLLAVLGIALTFHVAVFGFRLLSWILKKIPFVN